MDGLVWACAGELRRACGEMQNVVVMGHSMGGLLALKLAVERQVAGVVSLATPIFLTSRKSALAVIVQYFIKYINKKPRTLSTQLDESCAYTKTPIRCVVSLRKLLKHVKSLLPQVDAPIWIGQGARMESSIRGAQRFYMNAFAPEVKSFVLCEVIARFAAGSRESLFMPILRRLSFLCKWHTME